MNIVRTLMVMVEVLGLLGALNGVRLLLKESLQHGRCDPRARERAALCRRAAEVVLLLVMCLVLTGCGQGKAGMVRTPSPAKKAPTESSRAVAVNPKPALPEPPNAAPPSAIPASERVAAPPPPVLDETMNIYAEIARGIETARAK
jgi:hypothetical protein